MVDTKKCYINVSISWQNALDAINQLALNLEGKDFCQFDIDRLKRITRIVERKLKES